MNITVIGTGYVGLVTGACLAESGMNVLCMDADAKKIEQLKHANLPIYEPDLQEIVARNLFTGRLQFSMDINKAVQFAEVILIAVGTPSKRDGTVDLQYVLQVANDIAKHMDTDKIIVTKSTVPVGTGRHIARVMEHELEKQKKQARFYIASNPEFLREGSAVQDFVRPDRIVIGSEDEKAVHALRTIYQLQLKEYIPLVVTNLETAEMIKYASNAFLASKISFINEIANLCDRCGADVCVVAKAMGLDHRIGPDFLNAGPGFGGSCFPKDTKAMLHIGKSLGYLPTIVKSVIKVNEKQKIFAIQKIKETLGPLKKKTVSILGLAFKPGTDDIRESPAIPMIQKLIRHKAKVKVYDPQALAVTKLMHPQLEIDYCENVYAACQKSDCIVLVTEWEEFKNLDFHKLKSIVRTPIFIDLRNVYTPEEIRKWGFVYRGMGRG